MLRAGKVGLRARDEADIAVLHAELYEDIATYVIADSRPWRPIPAASGSGALAQATSDLIPYSLLAAVCLATLVFVRVSPRTSPSA